MANNERGAGRKPLGIETINTKVTLPVDLLADWERVGNKREFVRNAVVTALKEHKNKERKMLEQAFNEFMISFEEACVSATNASFGGSGYSVELFPDGIYRVLWDGQIGNMYNSAGLILAIPTLGEDEWDEENGHFFDNAEQLMREKFKQAISEC